MTQESANLGFYYPGHIWVDSDLIKNLIRFFDGIALLVPEYKRLEIFRHDPAIAEALMGHGLLQLLSADEFIDSAAASELSDQVIKLLDSRALDTLEPATDFDYISMSRLGFMAEPILAQRILKKLQKRKLAGKSEDGVAVPIHPMVRYLILTLWSQILRKTGHQRGLDLSPVTDRPQIQASLRALLSLPSMPSAAHIVTLDSKSVGLDVSAVPLEELLAFRNTNGDKYQAYARSLRRFVRELAAMPQDEVATAIKDRQEEIDQAADELRREASHFLTEHGASIGLGIMGSAWTAATGEVGGAVVGIASAAITEIVGAFAPHRAEAYSYLLSAKSRFA